MFDVAAPRTHTNPPLVDLFQSPLLGGRRMSVPAGQAIFEPTNPASNVYFIHRGQVRIYQIGPDNSLQLLEILGPNDYFGIESLAGKSSHHVRAIAYGPAIVSEISLDRFFAVLQQQPKAAVELVRSLAGRLHQAREESGRLIFDNCNSRLLKALIRFSRSAAATQSTTGVTVHITHQQLAQAIGVARETVSLALKELRDQNILQTGRNQLTFNPVSLEQLLARS